MPVTGPVFNVTQEKISSRVSSSAGYRIDHETRNLVVYVIDQRNKKVLRTIPSSVLAKLPPGEVINLTA